ncbi:MAG: hypothetical protein WDZ53_00250 [Balneolales bacterium]
MARKIAAEYGVSLLDVFEKATENLQKITIIDQLHSDYENLIRDSNTWKAVLHRREQFGINLPDGKNPK